MDEISNIFFLPKHSNKVIDCFILLPYLFYQIKLNPQCTDDLYFLIQFIQTYQFFQSIFSCNLNY